MQISLSILLASEFPVVRFGMSAYLSDRNDMACLHRAESLQQTVDYLANEKADVAIIDLSLLKPSGLAELRQLLKQDVAARIKLTI